MSADPIERLLSEARQAHRLHDLATRSDALDAAWALCAPLGFDHPLTHRVAWKRAKARHTAGDDGLDAVLPLFEDPDVDPFAFYDRAVPGANQLARDHQDTQGYGDARVRLIWTRLAQHQRDRKHLTGWAHGILQLAWDSACTGDLADLDTQLTVVERSPVDTVSVDVAHTALRAATWSDAKDRVDEARAALLDAVDGRKVPDVVSEALLESAVLHGGRLPDPYPPSSPYRERFQQGLRHPAHLPAAMEAGTELGPEWCLAPWSIARAHGLDLAGGAALIDASGCHAFRRG